MENNMEQTTQTPMPPPMSQVRMVSYAGFWKRFLALVIDKLILGVVSLIVIVPFIAMVGVSAFLEHDIGDSIGLLFALISAYFFLILIVVIIDWLYFAIMESTRGATLGKMALGIKVTDMSGGMISFGRATGRYFAKIISGIILYIGYVMAGFTQQKQALHDIIAGTLVVNK